MKDHDLILFLNVLLRPCVQLFRGASWTLYASSLNQNTPVPHIWQRIRRTDVRHTILLSPVPHSATGDGVGDPSQVVENLSSQFSQVSEGPHLSQSFQTLKQNTRENLLILTVFDESY